MEPMVNVHPIINCVNDCWMVFNKSHTSTGSSSMTVTDRHSSNSGLYQSRSTDSHASYYCTKHQSFLAGYHYHPYRKRSSSTDPTLPPSPARVPSPEPYKPKRQHQQRRTTTSSSRTETTTVHTETQVATQQQSSVTHNVHSPVSFDGNSSSSSDETSQVYNKGDWTEEEHARFVQGYNEVGCQWKIVAEKFVKTRDRRQTSSHAQNFLKKLKKQEQRRQGTSGRMNSEFL